MCITINGKKINGIITRPKPEKKRWVKPKVLTIEVNNLNDVRIYAEDSFWAAWEKYHFNLSLVLAFYKLAPQVTDEKEIKITDGKSVIIGKRTGERSVTLTGGYTFKTIHSEDWANKKGFNFTPHRQVRVNLDHRRHFVDRYKKRGFDLRLMAIFISKVPMAKLGQRVKVISKNDILIGTRTTEYGSMLITGMVRGKIDFNEYVDRRIF